MGQIFLLNGKLHLYFYDHYNILSFQPISMSALKVQPNVEKDRCAKTILAHIVVTVTVLEPI